MPPLKIFDYKVSECGLAVSSFFYAQHFKEKRTCLKVILYESDWY
jgi:hypothetical protein